jgi:hypothetical protein
MHIFHHVKKKFPKNFVTFDTKIEFPEFIEKPGRRNIFFCYSVVMYVYQTTNTLAGSCKA